MLMPLPYADAPVVHLAHLDDLWFQITGTLCNLACRHCFISCSPHNNQFGFMSRDQVERALEESVRLGVKEYYFTGGEPFLHPELVPLICRTLELGPVTVLTNATVLRKDWLEELARAEANSPYSLEFRVSLDGYDAASNDAIRGEGVFARTIRGLKQLLDHGFLPIVTVTHLNENESQQELFFRFVEMLKAHGYTRPRVKILPLLRIGAEAQRSGPYERRHFVAPDGLDGYDVGQLLCHHSRIVTDRGVYVCPILLDAPEARLGDRLADSLGGFALRYQACYTCYSYGAICANASAQQRDW